MEEHNIYTYFYHGTVIHVNFGRSEESRFSGFYSIDTPVTDIDYRKIEDEISRRHSDGRQRINIINFNLLQKS